MKKLILGGCVAAMALLAPAEKALVGYGWEFLSVTTEDVHRNRAKFAATGLDGVILPVDGKNEKGKILRGRDLLNDTPWTDRDFAGTVGLLSDITATDGLKSSYALTFLIPEKRVAWTDDARWAAIAGKARILARTAKAGGLKGLAIDHEDYTKQKQFLFRQEDPPYAETFALVRRRAAQVFQPVFEEFPEAEIMSFWFFSELTGTCIGDRGNAPGVAAGEGRLLFAFVNGILDVLPPTARLVDASEHGYNSIGDDFRVLAWRIARGGLPLAAPENRAKYANNVFASFGQYVDRYTKTNTSSKCHFEMECGSMVNAFTLHLLDGWNVAEGPIWIYGEAGTWIDWDRKDCRNLQYPLWERRLPGLAERFRMIKGDLSSLEAAAKEGRLQSLLANSGCDAAADAEPTAVPRPYGTYTSLKTPPAGLFSRDPRLGADAPGCLKLAGTGCFTPCVQGLKTGDLIYVRLKTRGGPVSVNLAWRRNNAWNWDLGNHYLGAPLEACPDEWQTLATFMITPDGADGIGLVMTGPATPASPIYFDDIGIYVKRLN